MVHTQRIPRLAAAVVLAASVLTVPAAQAADAKPGAVVNGAFAPQSPGATQFGPDKSRECPRNPILVELERQLPVVAEQNKLPVAQKDGQLCAVAVTFLGWKDTGAIPGGVAEGVAKHLGVPARPGVQVAQFASSAPEDVVPALLQTLANFMANSGQPRYGLAVEAKRARGTSRAAEERKESARVVLVLLDEPIAFQPFPRKLAQGASGTVAGELLGEWQNPKLLVSDATGKLSTPEQAAGKAFKAAVACGDKPGRIQVEIRGEIPAGSRTLASVPILCGGELATTFPLAGEEWPKDTAAQEQKLAEAVNAERTAAGLPPLEWDPALAGVAREVSQKLKEAITAGRAPEVDTGALLKQADLSSPVVLQNPAEAASAEEAAARFTASPTNRQNIFSAEVNHLGVGIVPNADASGRNTVLVTELFTRVLPAIDVVKTKAEVYAEVEKLRAEAKAPAAALDPRIDKVAQAYADALAKAGGKLSDDRAGELTQPLKGPYKSINMIEGAKASVADFLKDSTVTWDGSAIGIGLAQGNHPLLGKNTVYLTLIVATLRGEEKGGKAPAKAPAKPAKPAGKKK